MPSDQTFCRRAAWCHWGASSSGTWSAAREMLNKDVEPDVVMTFLVEDPSEKVASREKRGLLRSDRRSVARACSSDALEQLLPANVKVMIYSRRRCQDQLSRAPQSASAHAREWQPRSQGDAYLDCATEISGARAPRSS